MKGKLGATLFALVFAIPFGGVGAFATYGVASVIGESNRAEEWVLVQARVNDAQLQTSRGSKGGTSYQAVGTYSYAFGDKSYIGARLGFDALGGADNIGDWQTSMAAYLEEAKKSGKTIPVFVNPDNPAEAVVDREVRWGLLLFMAVFAVVFGGVGVGAVIAMGFIWFGKSGTARGTEIRTAAVRAKGSSAASDAWKGAGVLWLFAFFWNAISFPIAILAVPEIIANEEWVGLLVLLFPLVGILLLWGAISSTIGLLRRGKASLTLQPEKPRAGSSFNGALTFPRGVKPGEAFKVRLVCNKTVETSQETNTSPAWSTEKVVNAQQAAQGARVAFRFDVPADVPRREVGFERREVSHAWRIEVGPAKNPALTNDGFDIEIEPAPGAALASPAAPEPAAAFIPNATLVQLLGAEAAAKLSAQQRAAFAEMTPEQQALAGKVVRNAPQIKKAVIAIVVIFVGIQILGSVIAVVAAFFQ